MKDWSNRLWLSLERPLKQKEKFRENSQNPPASDGGTSITVLLVLQLISAALVSISGNTAETLVSLFACYITYDTIRFIRDKS